MDGMTDIPAADLDAIYVEVAGFLADEYSLIQQVKNPDLRRRLIVAHGRLHYCLKDRAAEHGIPSGPSTMSGGTDKPPRPV